MPHPLSLSKLENNMPRKPYPNFAETDEFDPNDVEVAEPTVVVNDGLVTARVKGTRSMMWGSTVYNFIDGQRVRIPRDLFEYLRSYQNIYDTMA